MKIGLRHLLLSVAISLSTLSMGQCLMMPLPLSERVAASDLLAHGRVLGHFSFESDREGHIYTAYLIAADMVYKGSVDTFYVITQGGEWGNRTEKVTPSLSLHSGDEGVFFCTLPFATPSHTLAYPCYSAYGDAQGFVRYEDEMAFDVFHTYLHSSELSDIIVSHTNTKPILSPAFSHMPPIRADKSNANPTISSLSPSTISAGTFSVLTITGSGFGSTQGSGSVGFSYMDGTGAYINPHPSQYISWSDQQIQVVVPDQAGSGRVKVTQGGISSQGYDSIYVPYDVEQWVHNDTAYEYFLSDIDSAGGYRWYMNATMATTTAALATFTRAMDVWRCATHINWLYGGTTAIDTSGSGQSVVRFGRSNELAAGVLGTLHWINYSCLAAGLPKTFISYYDMVISPSYNWCYGPQQPQPSQVDMQTIMEHELGHAHVINHVSGPQSDFMHSTTPNGQIIRALSAGNLTGATFSLGHSVGQNICGIPTHIYDTRICTNDISETDISLPLSIYPNPVYHKIMIHSTAEAGMVEIYNSLGQVIFTQKTNNVETEANLSPLLPGIYFARYRDTAGDGSRTVRLVKY